MFDDQKNTVKAVTLPHPGELLIIEPLDYPNPYDFQHLHRHDYFEIILIESGHGNQLLDFVKYEMSPGQIYSIYPGQVHLMNRKSAQGLLIQFRKNIFEYLFPLKHFDLYFNEPAFHMSAPEFQHIYGLTEQIQKLLSSEELTLLSKHKAYNYLQIILITLAEIRQVRSTHDHHNLVSEFLFLLTEHIYNKRKVADYCAIMQCSPEKLSAACKSTLGKTPLQFIHEEVMLEIKRLLLLGKMTIKEIAYELNFDSPANFSGFIKSRIHISPSELQEKVSEIYK